MTTLHDLSIAALKEAILIKEEIEKLAGRLTTLLSDSASSIVSLAGGDDKPEVKESTPSTGRKARSASRKKSSAGGRRGGLTPEGRARIVAALKARWAAKRKAGGISKPSVKSTKAKGRGLTPEGRARLAAVMKARWAARRKSGAPALNTPKRRR